MKSNYTKLFTGSGVAENMRRPRPDSDVNNLERYFAANPLKEMQQP